MILTRNNVEIVDLDGVQKRYHLPGPHATVVMPVPKPGAQGGDLRDRWHALRNDLRHDGATPAMLEQLDALAGDLHAGAATVLLSANEESAVSHFLTGTVTRSSWHVGPLPWMLPVIESLELRQPVVGAVVDRLGADLMRFTAYGLEPAGEVTGEEDVHKTSRGGWSQPNYQRHAEVVWERNAERVAEAIGGLCARTSTTTVMLTGEPRMTRLLTRLLEREPRLECQVVQRGGRHEPQTPRRLQEEAATWRRRRHGERLQRRLEVFREQLGHQDLAVDGSMLTLCAVADRRVRTLLLDTGVAHYPLFDTTARDALDQGADVVLAPLHDHRDGMGALLRSPIA